LAEIDFTVALNFMWHFILLLPGYNTEGEWRWMLYCCTYHAWWNDTQTRSVCSCSYVVSL